MQEPTAREVHGDARGAALWRLADGKRMSPLPVLQGSVARARRCRRLADRADPVGQASKGLWTVLGSAGGAQQCRTADYLRKLWKVQEIGSSALTILPTLLP
jgi:hypothetical protein